MTKVKIRALISSVFLGFLSSSFAQSEYQLSFYKCDENGINSLDYRLHSPELTISDYVTYQKIECQKPTNGTYKFTTNKEIIRVGIKNIYNQDLDTILKLKKNITVYKLCPEKFLDYELKTSLEKSFEKRNKWTLQYSSKGVNSSGRNFNQNESLTITYTRTKIIATHRVNKGKKKKITLNDEQKEILINFEKKLKLMNRKNSACQIYSDYFVSTKEEYFSIENNTCLWDGFNELKVDLGL